MRCLLVDDEPGIREGLATLLRKKGLEVRTAGACADAADALAHEFDVVVTDWRLPDGTADTFWAAARCPVIAVSGHPEEVVRSEAVCEVLTKPVSLARLLQVLQALPQPPAMTAAALPGHWPVDVRRAVSAFADRLPDGARTSVHDDGTFVTIDAEVAGALPRDLQLEHGDLRVWRAGAGHRARLRLRRDGRPAGALAVVPPDGDWPAAGDFAVDFHDSTIGVVGFASCLDRAVAVRRRGGRMQFLNVPDELLAFVSSHGRADDMPMREPVGPGLQAEFADLWREP